MIPTLKQLRYFSTLTETMHFGRAAELCHVTQPALSMQVRELEATLGTTLVERTPSGLVLTWEGEEVARRARAILLAVQTSPRSPSIAGGTCRGSSALA